MAKKIFEPDNPKPFKVSRSKIENFIRCKACFWMDRVKGINFPGMPGGNIRDWLYVDDHIKALLKIVESDFEYTTFNIGANQEISNLKLAELICSILDSMNPRTDSVSYKEQISFVGDRLGHDFRYAINSKKLQEEMGFSIESDLENGITKTVDWYLKNRNWLLSKHNSE